MGGADDAFLSKLNNSGSALLYSTYLGGSDDDGIVDIAVDPLSTVYLTGMTLSSDFPVTPGVFDTGLTGIVDAFVAHFDLYQPAVPVFEPACGMILWFLLSYLIRKQYRFYK